MKNIILVGNGFDLSHNLRTKYTQFINNVGAEEFNLIYDEYVDDPVRIIGKPKEKKSIAVRNKLYYKIRNTKKDLWCDIESIYFKELFGTSTPHDLNLEFEKIKEQFSKYLLEVTSKIEIIKSYETLFSKFKTKPTVINFNYTSTAHLYENLFHNIIHIHGNLKDNMNPIIFGYAADNEQTSTLLGKADDEYLRNIKQYEYLGTDNFRKTLKLLDSANNINVFLLGLSCGESDKLILKKIFDHENVKNIFNFYYNSRGSHLTKLMNINRIISEDTGFKKYMPMPNCLRIPQYNNELNDSEIQNFFKINLEYGL